MNSPSTLLRAEVLAVGVAYHRWARRQEGGQAVASGAKGSAYIDVSGKNEGVGCYNAQCQSEDISLHETMAVEAARMTS